MADALLTGSDTASNRWGFWSGGFDMVVRRGSGRSGLTGSCLTSTWDGPICIGSCGGESLRGVFGGGAPWIFWGWGRGGVGVGGWVGGGGGVDSKADGLILRTATSDEKYGGVLMCLPGVCILPQPLQHCLTPP